MGKLVVLKLGEGDFERGFPVTLQIGVDGCQPFVETTGRLPPGLEILEHYGRWHSAYCRLGVRLRLSAPEAQVTNISVLNDCSSAAQRLSNSLNAWLNSESFRSIREKLLEKLMPSDEVRVVLQAEDHQLRRLPWHLWDFFERYPKAELALSTPIYERAETPSFPTKKVRILAILGSSNGIDVQADRALLERLSSAEIKFLVEPQLKELTDQLWEQGWDILDLPESCGNALTWQGLRNKTEYRGDTANIRQDWGEAIDVSVFYGCTEELAELKQWIVNDSCRLVALLGMGGIGKTALSVKLAEQIQDQFEYLVWRSLRNAPPVEEILTELIQFLSDQQETALPNDLNGRISRLIDYLRWHRCLLVLDNAETILGDGEHAGHYRGGYEGYGEFLRRVGEERHQSCLVLTSREKPKEFVFLEGETLAVRSLQLSGLKEAEGREIIRRKGSFSGSEGEWRALIEHYAGNPLALKMVAPAIYDLFDDNVSQFLEFLQQGTLVFDDIRDLLDRQFNRLSDLEKEIMYWLAIECEPISLPELRDNILSPALRRRLPEAVISLGHRALIEKSAGNFTQQPVVMQYMTERLIEQVYEEIETKEIGLLMSHALTKATAKDYIRESQVRLILEPIADRLRTNFKSNQDIERQLNRLLSK